MKKRFVVVIKKILTNILNGKFRFGKKAIETKRESLKSFETLYMYINPDIKKTYLVINYHVYFLLTLWKWSASDWFIRLKQFNLLITFNEKYVERTNWPSSWSRKIEIHHGYSLPLKYRDVILSQSLAKTLLFLRSMARRVKPDGKLKVTASHDTYIPSRINTGVKIFLAGNIIFCWAYEYQEFKISRAF